MSSPEKTMEKPSPTPESPTPESPTQESPTPESPTPILSLPDDLLVSCFARVSAFEYQNLSLVSKKFSSLLSSPELHEIRSLLSLTETCLFVCFRFPSDNKPRWCFLSPKPDSTGYVLSPILIIDSPQSLWREQVVVLDSTIYAIGGPIDDEPSSSVWALDCGSLCGSHSWREAPSMRMERFCATANVFDGRIYVAGGCEGEEDCDSSNWMEVFDPKTETWELVPSPLADKCGSRVQKSAVVEGEIIMVGRNGVGYKPKEDKWEELGPSRYMNLGSKIVAPCLIDNVIYRFQRFERIVWYDKKGRYWKEVKGLESLPKFDVYAFAKLVDYGGKMVVLWEKVLPCSGDDHQKKMIWCAVIALERRSNNQIQEMWGNVEWFDGLRTVPASCGFFCTVAATV